MALPDWPRAYGKPATSATIRDEAADFDVTENLGFELDDSGEHDYLFIEKCDTNTHWVARQLAEFAGVPVRDIGYSGLKDRRAVTRQWFSVPRWNSPSWSALQVDGVSIAQVARHSRKLRRGAHKSNSFRIVMRNVDTELSIDSIEEKLQKLEVGGVPNYFGPQRFGRGGNNLQLAKAWSQGKRLPRDKRSIAISAVRSLLFNDALAERVTMGTWNILIDGDIANLDGSGSVFGVEVVDEEISRRCRELDIHPTGELPGDGSDASAIASDHQQWLQALIKARVKVARRSFRLRIQDLRWTIDDDVWTLSFELGRGAFATSVLREIADC